MSEVPGPDPEETEEESLSPAERMGNAISDWLRDRPRGQRRYDPLEVALFALVVALSLYVLIPILNIWGLTLPTGSPFYPLSDGTVLVDLTTAWASLPVAVIVLGTSLLARHQIGRYAGEVEACAEASDDCESEEDLADLDELVWSDLGHLRRARVAVGASTVLAALTVIAALVMLAWTLANAQFSLNPNLVETTYQSKEWYGYTQVVLASLVVVVPALAAVLISPRPWARASGVLAAAKQDPARDETEAEGDPVA